MCQKVINNAPRTDTTRDAIEATAGRKAVCAAANHRVKEGSVEIEPCRSPINCCQPASQPHAATQAFGAVSSSFSGAGGKEGLLGAQLPISVSALSTGSSTCVRVRVRARARGRSRASGRSRVRAGATLRVLSTQGASTCLYLWGDSHDCAAVGQHRSNTSRRCAPSAILMCLVRVRARVRVRVRLRLGLGLGEGLGLG